MKKILPLFFFIFIHTLARGQAQYTVSMDLVISYNGNADKAECGSRFEITAYFSDGSSSKVWTQSLDGLRDDEVRTYSKQFYFPATKRLTGFYIFGRRSWDRGWPAGCKKSDVEDSKTVAVSPSQPCYTTTRTGFIPRYTRGDMTISVYPSTVTATPYYQLFTDESTVTMNATAGFPNSTYRWQYRTPSTAWQDFPYAFQWRPSITFSGSDLPNNFFLNAYANRENIQVRVNYGCGNNYSNAATLSPRLSAPRIVSVTPAPPTCYGDQDGSFIVQFSRALKPKESLVLQLDKQEEPEGSPQAFIDSRQVTSMDPLTYRFSWPNDREARRYRIVLRGSYPNDVPNPVATYTEGPDYRRNFEITQPGPIAFNAVKRNDVRCYNGADGAVNISISGGNGGCILYYRNAADGINRQVSIGNSTAYTLGGLRPGVYTLWLRDSKGCMPRDAGNAEVQRTVTITEPPAPLVIDAATLTDPAAFGYSDGSIVVRLKGGTPNGDGSYNISWTGPDGAPVAHSGSAGSGIYTTTLSNIPDGAYQLRVTDANYAAAGSGSEAGCIVTATYTITQPPLLVVNAGITDSIACNGDGNGVITALATGGKPLALPPYYTYEWYEIVNGQPLATGQTGTVANGLSAGRYQVKVTDANGIEKMSGIINLVDPAPLQVQFTETPASCYNGSNGAVSALVTGGTPAYAYTWSNGSHAAGISNLPTGAYTLDITDYHGCRLTDVAFVQQPSAPLEIVTPALTYPRAYGYTDGSIKVLLSGGTPLAGGAYHVTWQRADGTVLTGHTGQAVAGGYESLLNNIGAGDYTITVTDAHYTGPGPGMQSCVASATFTLTEPPALTVAIGEKHYVSCKGDADGVLAATAAGGVPVSGPLPYYFAWYKADNGVYNAIGQTTDTARGLSTGIYKVIITDWNGITKESAPFHLVEPDQLQVQLQARAVSCHSGDDGFVKSTVTGGTRPYTWSWNTGATAANVLGQPAGDYSLLLTDAHGCMQQAAATVTEPAAPLAITNVVISDPLAFGYTDGHITVTLDGGTPAADGSYSIQWLDANGQPLTQHTEQLTPGGYVTRLENAGDGRYTLQVKDAQFSRSSNGSTNGCYISADYTLTEPPLLKVYIAQHRYVSCNGDSDGQLVAHAVGGIPLTGGLPYQYQWFKVSNGSLTPVPQTDSIIHGMAAGRYLVKVTDYNHITRSSDTFRLTEPAPLSVAISTTAVTCASGQDGSATGIVSGGTAPFRYEWTTGDTTASIRNITEGSYLLFIKDAHGCETQRQADIYIPGGIVIDADIKAPTCNGDCDGYIRTSISGGVPPYTYEWNTGHTGPALEHLCAGRYTLTITDANNCRRIQTFSLPDPAPLQVQLGADKTLCNGQVWTVSAAIADPQASYVWGGSPAFQAAAPQVTLRNSGQYWVSVTDSKGCTGSDTIRIQQNRVDISAEFVAATQVFRNETVSLINISSPLPEKTEWIIPANRNITVLQNSTLLAELRFGDTGVYHIQLRSTIGDCEQVFSKQIAVLEQQSFTQPGGAQEPFIRSFEVMPNPNTGQFSVRISLDKVAEIRLRLFNIISNQLVSDRKESPAQQFNIGYQLNVTAGTYVLLLETPRGPAIRKIIISQ